MENLKNLKLPNWIIKNIQYGKEGDLTSLVIGIIAISAVCAIAYFVHAPFGREHLFMEVIAAIVILALIGLVGFWLLDQVAPLESIRREALISFKKSKTEEEEKDAIDMLKRLYVPIPEKEKKDGTSKLETVWVPIPKKN